MEINHNVQNEVTVLGAGCFWCTEAVFQSLKGVVSVLPGYSGGNTGHIEVAKIEFNPEIISFEILLEVFFALHDPTTLNQQGNDVGEQYASTIFYTSDQQRELAEKFIKKLTEQKIYELPIVTQVRPLEKFYEAENYHRNYMLNNPDKLYCKLVINPKLQKLREKFTNLIKQT